MYVKPVACHSGELFTSQTPFSHFSIIFWLFKGNLDISSLNGNVYLFSVYVYLSVIIVFLLLYIHYTISIFNLMYPSLLFYSAYHHAILLVRGIVL